MSGARALARSIYAGPKSMVNAEEKRWQQPRPIRTRPSLRSRDPEPELVPGAALCRPGASTSLPTGPCSISSLSRTISQT